MNLLLPHLLQLFRHMQWADAVLWRAALATPELQDDTRARDLLFHIHQVQHAFLSVWRGEEVEWKEPGAFPDFPALARWGREYHERVPEYLATVREEQLNDVKEVAWRRWVEKAIGRPPGPTTLGEMMMQVSQHSTYHRGQVNARLRERGGSPPLTDYIAWLWLEKPDAEWPV